MKYRTLYALCFGALIASINVHANTSFETATPDLIAKGQSSYKMNCASCHGDTGDGNGPAGKMLKPKPRNFMTEPFKMGDTPQKVFDSISKGLPGTLMAGFGHLSAETRWGLTHYVLSLRAKK